MDINKVLILGKIRSKKAVTSGSGMRILNIIVITTRSWADPISGEQKEKSEWHRVVAYGNVASKAETISDGSYVYIEGNLRTREIIPNQTEGENMQNAIPVRITEVVATKIVADSNTENKSGEDSTVDVDKFDDIPF